MTYLAVSSHFLPNLHALFGGELGRAAATLLVIAAAFTLHRLNLRYLSGKVERANGLQGSEGLRERMVITRNGLLLAALLVIGTIWATKIAGVALSLAAFAGALVLSGKELLMCVQGYVLYTMGRPFSVGDYIEISGLVGRVVDVDIFATTLAEISSAHQLTGRHLTLPNSLLLSAAVRNQTPTGDYVLHQLRVVVPYDVDRERLEVAAVKAANEVCAPWFSDADAHLRRIEDKDFLDLPSSEVRVLWEAHDYLQHWLVIRFVAPVSMRVTAEQDIQRRFWKEVGRLPSTGGGRAPAPHP